MNTLAAGNRAPEFSLPDLDGRPVRLTDFRGRKVLLVFFRYATCPFCTVRFVRLAQEAKRYADAGVQIIGVFESSAGYIREYLGRRGLPFPVIPDPDGKLYALYGVRKSVPGLLFGMFRLPTLLRALFDPAYRMAQPDGSLTRIPANFLIDENQIVVDAYYGNDIGDHIPFARIDHFAAGTVTGNMRHV
ncbi:peroxiredoxin family protein [Sulfurivermis fontis]|uniref:peroxiredoxin family protein n=1 Tax=Sulfurivermis fontis TaxID=1972068 RepID=UPI000FDB3DBA|nr:redoxin domain-containing protein [Sulfurivermis fontis]